MISEIGDYIFGLVIIIGILFSILFLLFYFIYKGRVKTITIMDKWISHYDVFDISRRDEEIYSNETIDNDETFEPGTYIVICCDYRGKPKKGKVRYCNHVGIYDELEIGKTYVVFKKFKTILEIL